VFSPKTGQEKLFKQSIIPIVDEVLDGFNCTIFAYGQTGTGKTYTMEGGPRNSSDGSNLSAEAGVIPRSIRHIFDYIEASNNSDSSVKVSFLELYNEELTDLLAPTDDKDNKRLRLLEDRSGVVVQGLEEVIVKSATEIYQVLDRGTAKRRTAETLLNKRSSRSHSVFTITIHMRESIPDGDDVIKIGKLNLVDLAGSENISRSGAKDDRAREAGSINQSLLTLGRVITALVEHCGHVPYRDSKLTRLLRDSLGGRTKTCIIATIGPSVHCVEETISTLDYAYRAKNIRNRPEVNQKISKATMIKELNAEIEKLKGDLVATREKNGVYLSADNYQADELERVQLRQRVTVLEAEMEQLSGETQAEMEKRELAHATEVARLGQLLEVTQRQLHTTQGQLQKAQARVEETEFLISSQQRSEQSMIKHAEGLTADLQGTCSDLEAMFAKLEQLVSLQNGDRMVMKTVADYAAERLAALEGAVQQESSRQQEQADKVRPVVHQNRPWLFAAAPHPCI
jgi:kinesin family member 11